MLLSTLTALSFSLNVSAAPAKNLIEDCKYVSLNNSLKMAADQGKGAQLALSMRSQEVKNGGAKVQTVVIDLSGSVKKTVGFKFALNDPETGTCSLSSPSDSIKALTAAELEATKILPKEEKVPGKPERYWNECNTQAVNLALQVWVGNKPGVAPKLEYNSQRGEDQGVYRYTINISPADSSVISKNPDRSQPSSPNAITVLISGTKKADGSCDVKIAN